MLLLLLLAFACLCPRCPLVPVWCHRRPPETSGVRLVPACARALGAPMLLPLLRLLLLLRLLFEFALALGLAVAVALALVSVIV